MVTYSFDACRPSDRDIVIIGIAGYYDRAPFAISTSTVPDSSISRLERFHYRLIGRMRNASALP